MAVEVKICGLTSAEDATTALELGADYVGFVLYPHSPRGIFPEHFFEIVQKIGNFQKVIAVLVNPSRQEVEKLLGAIPVRAIQLHGTENPAEFGSLPVPVWRALRLRDKVWDPAPEGWPAERYVLDAFRPGCWGGTGTVADWAAAAQLATRRPIMLAGGLTPENVAEAVRTVRPLGVDVSSGVETAPGKKDIAKLSRFILNARAAAP